MNDDLKSEEERDLKPDEERKPGDEAPPGEPSSGENACPECEGSGEKNGTECPNCQGTGKVNEAIGGG